MRHSAVIVFVFSTFVACADRGITEADQYTERTLHVFGLITDCADDSPLAAARVRVYDWYYGGETTLARTTTDESGHYEMSFSDRKLCDAARRGSGSLQFVISASRPGYRTGARGGLMTDGVRCIEGTQRFDICLRQLQ